MEGAAVFCGTFFVPSAAVCCEITSTFPCYDMLGATCACLRTTRMPYGGHAFPCLFLEIVSVLCRSLRSETEPCFGGCRTSSVNRAGVSGSCGGYPEHIQRISRSRTSISRSRTADAASASSGWLEFEQRVCQVGMEVALYSEFGCFGSRLRKFWGQTSELSRLNIGGFGQKVRHFLWQSSDVSA